MNSCACNRPCCKTIVFITHDFDEAMRLADRIAIMKDGRDRTDRHARRLVLNPATDYVREFTRAVPKAKAVRVASLAHTDRARL
jgi:glycine betaine/proline transport system ATP-binding protein